LSTLSFRVAIKHVAGVDGTWACFQLPRGISDGFFFLAFFLSFWLSFFLGAMSANPQWIIRDRNKRNKYNNTLLMNVNVGECQRIMCG